MDFSSFLKLGDVMFFTSFYEPEPGQKGASDKLQKSEQVGTALSTTEFRPKRDRHSQGTKKSQTIIAHLQRKGMIKQRSETSTSLFSSKSKIKFFKQMDPILIYSVSIICATDCFWYLGVKKMSEEILLSTDFKLSIFSIFLIFLNIKKIFFNIFSFYVLCCLPAWNLLLYFAF